MPFHRLTNPTYFVSGGGLLPGHDKINDPAHPTVGGSGTAAPVDGLKSGGSNDGTYFVAFGENGLSSNANRPHEALAENTDELDDIIHSSLPRVVSLDATAVGAVSSIALTGEIFVGRSGAANDQNQRDRLVHILNQTGDELEVGGIKIVATLIHDGSSNNVVGTQADGFRTNATVNVSPAIPNGTAYRVIYGIRSNYDDMSRDFRGWLAEPIIQNYGGVPAAVQTVLRSLHASSGQAWNSGWDATIKALASGGLNERYRRSTAEVGSFTYNNPGDGATILRDGQAIVIQYPDILNNSPIGTPYPDKMLGALRAESLEALASGGWPNLNKGGDVFLFQESDLKTTLDSNEYARTRVAGPMLLEAIPRDIRAATLNGDPAVSKIDSTLVATANPDSGTTADARRTVHVNTADFVWDSNNEASIRLTDLIEVINNATGNPIGVFRVSGFASPFASRILLKTLSGGNPDFGAAALSVRLRWLQVTTVIGGSHRSALSSGWYPFMVMQPSRATTNYGNNTIHPAAVFLSATRDRNQIEPFTNPDPFTALAWGGFSRANGVFALVGKLFGDGSALFQGGRQEVNLLKRRLTQLDLPFGGGGGTITWNPSGGSLIRVNTSTSTTSPITVTFAINTATDNWVFRDGDTFTLVMNIQAATTGAISMIWPSNFVFRADEAQPPQNVFGEEIRVKWDFVFEDGVWLATRTDYPDLKRLGAVNNIRSIAALGNDASDTTIMSILWSPFTNAPRWQAFVGSGGTGEELYDSRNGVQWAPLSSTISGAYEAVFINEVIILAIGTAGLGLNRSVDGGVSFSGVTATDLNYQRLFSTGSSVIASAVGGALRRSIDDGATWAEPPTPPINWGVSGYLAAQFARNPKTGRIIGVPETGNRFIYSDDDGATWSEVAVTSLTYRGIACKDGVWFVTTTASGSPIWRSLDDGITWTQLTSNFPTTGSSNARKMFVHAGLLVVRRGSRIMYSANGINWHWGVDLAPIANPNIVQDWNYGGGGFAAISRVANTETYLITTYQESVLLTP